MGLRLVRARFRVVVSGCGFDMSLPRIFANLIIGLPDAVVAGDHHEE